MNQPVLEVDGKPVQQLYQYAIRWTTNLASGENESILYFDGKRVTKPWKLTMAVEAKEDKTGASANTN